MARGCSASGRCRTCRGKTEWMAALLAEAVGDAGTAGVVVSCGQQIGPGAATEDYRGNGGISGISGMRRRLDALRTREIIIVPLTPGAAGQASLWRDMYDAEPGWMERQMRAASLPGITAIEAWSLSRRRSSRRQDTGAADRSSKISRPGGAPGPARAR